MSYEHVTSLPFLIASSQLTPEEAAERDADPAQWAARRYGQPVRFFRAAGEFAYLKVMLTKVTFLQPSAMQVGLSGASSQS